MADKRELTMDQIQAVLKQLDDFLDNLKQQWDGQNQSAATWWSVNRSRLVSGTKFILNSLDDMIQFVEDMIPAGSDKKAAVLSMSGRLFDYVVSAAFPIWLKPFVPAIKTIIVNIVIGNMIDFIVAKYSTGAWKPVDTGSVETKPEVTDGPQTN